MLPVTLWPYTCAETFENWVGLNDAHAWANHLPQQPDKLPTCDVNCRFDKMFHVNQSVFAMRYECY